MLQQDTSEVNELYQRIKDREDVVEPPHDTFYGMRELIIRDVNRFWITFGQPSAFAVLTEGVMKGDEALVESALKDGSLKPETLTSALAIASSGERKNATIVDLLKAAGATSPVVVDDDTLHAFAGTYQNERSLELIVTVKEGELFAALGTQEPLRMVAIDKVKFSPIAFEDYGTLTFTVEAGKVVGCVLTHQEEHTELKRK